MARGVGIYIAIYPNKLKSMNKIVSYGLLFCFCSSSLQPVYLTYAGRVS